MRRPGAVEGFLEQLVETYGYWAVLLGTFLEGETIVILAGFGAHRGYLTLPGVVLAAFAGSLASDQFFFFLGRRHAERILARRPRWRHNFERATRILERRQEVFMLGFRFLWGLRTISPFVLGASGVAPRRFLAFDLVATTTWAIAISLIGYALGEAAESLLGRLERYEAAIAVAIVAAGLLGWWITRYRAR